MPESDGDLDETDRAILFELQRDARHNTNAAIAETLDVSASTVGKRISRLEETGVVQGYVPEIDYEKAGFLLQVLFYCTAPIADRGAMVDDVRAIDGVVNVRELMTGEHNVHVLAVGASNDDITAIASAVDEAGLRVADEILLRDEYDQPSARFRGARNSDGS